MKAGFYPTHYGYFLQVPIGLGQLPSLFKKDGIRKQSRGKIIEGFMNINLGIKVLDL